MSEAYSLEPFSLDSLSEGLSSSECAASEIASSKRAAYLHGYLKQLDAHTLVTEHDYTDGDYLDDFASYYVRCFRTYGRRCKRLHFFSTSITPERFQAVVLRDASDQERRELVEAYLGFVVARPLPAAFIGRTVLRTYPSDGGRRHYPAVRRYSVSLFGIDLEVTSLAYQEQDTVLAACATVALWSAFHKTFELFGTPAPRPAEITRIANGAGSFSRAIPSHGLNLLQMAHAVRGVGLEPELVPAAQNIPIVSAAYAHLRGGLPVILGVDIESQGLHAITIAGYSLRDARTIPQEVASGERRAPMTGLRIDELYGHDDQVGPFARLKVHPSGPPYPVEFSGSWTESSTGRVLPLRPKFLLIPVYNKIRVTFVDILAWVERLWSAVSLLVSDTSLFEWDIFLTTTNEYKREVCESLKSYPRRSSLLLKQQPRFIWCVRLCFKGNAVFELLADATDMERSLPFFDSVWHDADFQKAMQTMLSHAGLQTLLASQLTARLLDFLRSR